MFSSSQRGARIRHRASVLMLARTVLALAALTSTLAAGSTALASEFGATAWGSGHDGQLGDGTGASKSVPAAISGLKGVTALSTGAPSDCGGSACGGHSLALLSDGTVMAWGSNEHGQLGRSGIESSDVPLVVPGLSRVRAVAAGGEYSLALLKDGTVMAWGYNHLGELGNATETDSSVPVAVEGLKHAVAIAAGEGFALAVLSDGTVDAWGSNNYGQLGDGASGPEFCGAQLNPCSRAPVSVSGLSSVTAVSAQANSALVLLADGTVSSWGGGANLPWTVTGLSEVTNIAAGSAHDLALRSDGTVDSWGANFAGQLGDGSTESRALPATVPFLAGVKGIAAGEAHSLALLEDGTVMSWGSDSQGQLGDDSTDTELCFTGYFEQPCSTAPVVVSGLSGVQGIAAGFDCSLAFGEPFPGVTAVTPGSGPTSGGNSVTITGINLSAATAVNFGATPASSFIVESETTITAVAPAGSGTVDVRVTTPPGTSAPGTSDSYTYGPTVSSVSPDQGPASGGTTVTVTGAGLSEATAVQFGSTAAMSFTVNSPTSITAVSPPGGGLLDVTVTTPEGTSPTRPGDRFGFIAQPLVAALSPNTGLETGGTPVTITGANFSAATAVTFGSVGAASFTVNSPTLITAVSPPGVGTVDVTVTTAGGTSTTSTEDQFSYVLFPPPTVTKVKPRLSPVAGGVIVTVEGTNLTKATAVMFGSTPALSLAVISPTRISAVAPPEPAAKVNVTVITPSGTSAISTKADHFRFAPTVSSVSPASGPVAGGSAVTITGTGFIFGASATTFKVGKSHAVPGNCISTTSCTINTPAHEAGTVDVKAVVNKLASPKSSPADHFDYE